MQKPLRKARTLALAGVAAGPPPRPVVPGAKLQPAEPIEYVWWY